MHYYFPLSLNHCIADAHTHNTDWRSLPPAPQRSAFVLSLAHAQQTLALAAASPTSSAFAQSLAHAQHTMPLAASPATFCLRSLTVSLDHPHCLCLSAPQLCREVASQRLCGFQRSKWSPTCYTAPSRLLFPSSPQVWRHSVQMYDHHLYPGMPLNPVRNVIDPGDNVIGTLPASLQLGWLPSLPGRTVIHTLKPSW